MIFQQGQQVLLHTSSSSQLQSPSQLCILSSYQVFILLSLYHIAGPFIFSITPTISITHRTHRLPLQFQMPATRRSCRFACPRSDSNPKCAAVWDPVKEGETCERVSAIRESVRFRWTQVQLHRWLNTGQVVHMRQYRAYLYCNGLVLYLA